MWNKIWCPSNRKVLALNLAASFFLTVFLELMTRRSFSDLRLFMEERTFVFLYNVLIIFVTFSIVFLVNKKYFAFGFIFAGWSVIGLANGMVLSSRKTPFSAVDLTIFKSTIPVLNNYLSLPEILGMILLLTLGIAGLVTLFLYCPNARKAFDFRVNISLVGLLLIFFGIATYLGVGRGLLISRFDNLIAGYQDYGTAYSFVITAVDTGIDRPIDYSRARVRKIRKLMDKRLKKKAEEESEPKKANIIFLQLESFFDITDLEGLQLSEDPLPNLHALQKETTYGYLKVPVYGAGTINTEFEVITGMNTSFFGTGEYPYRSILHKRTSESMAYWLKDQGYTASAIHNNNASFYDRNKVFSNLGFDYFITSENMNITKYNAAGWSADSVLEDYILSTLKGTVRPDYIYTISVQGHGDYPSGPVKNPKITVENKEMSESYRNTLTYYVNQLHEMDQFIGSLTGALHDFEEDTVLVFYGDHLPGLDIESRDLKSGSRFKTPYVIWDNFGYNAAHRRDETGNIKAYQLSAKVLSQLRLHNGVMNEFHQVMQGTKNYNNNMKTLQYDLLYGSGFSREGEPPLDASNIKYCITPVYVGEIRKNGKNAYVMGSHFTDYSRVYVNGSPVSTIKLGDMELKIPSKVLKDGDELVVHQVNKTHPNITLNTSNTFRVDLSKIEDVIEKNK